MSIQARPPSLLSQRGDSACTYRSSEMISTVRERGERDILALFHW
jgi:hypothetical protein